MDQDRAAIIHGLANEYLSEFSDVRLNIGINIFNGCYQIANDEYTFVVTLYPKTKWSFVKEKIDRLILKRETLCGMCNNNLNKIPGTCESCELTICINCYISIFKENKGIVKCNNCNARHGTILSDEKLETQIEYIRSRVT